MAERQQRQIKTVSYVHVGERLVKTERISLEGQRKLATWIKCTYLNALYEGKAKFRAVEEVEEMI